MDRLFKKGRNINDLSESEFLELFKKKIVFVMAFTSHLKDDILIEDNIEEFDSNIAKFSLVQCSSEIRSNYFDLLNCQIRR